MSDKIIKALQKATKKELIDIIEERMYLDHEFRKTLEHRLFTKEVSTEEQISSFQRQVKDEMERRHPGTSVIRSAVFALERNMESMPVSDFCRGCIAIIRTLDYALSYGAGMEVDSDFEISMDLENASRSAVERIRQCDISDSERLEILDMVSRELETPLSVYGSDMFTDIRDALG